jgi:hypothetical protein
MVVVISLIGEIPQSDTIPQRSASAKAASPISQMA